MSLEEKKKKRIYRNLFMLTIIALVSITGFSIYYIVEQQEKFANANENFVSIEELNALEEEKAILEAILQADEDWLLHGDPKSSEQKYLGILSLSKSFAPYVEQRIQRAKQVQGNSNDDELTKINLRTQLADVKDKLQTYKDSLDNVQDIFSDERRSKLKKLDSLTELVKESEKALARKETVKVISFKNENGNLIHYIGETKNEMANGGGVGIWNTGSIYRGEWKDNKRNGKGEFEWADGEKYEGEFVDGMRSGNGVFYYKSGERYEGGFKDNLRHGSGTLYDRDGNTSYKGQWKKDKPTEL